MLLQDNAPIVQDNSPAYHVFPASCKKQKPSTFDGCTATLSSNSSTHIIIFVFLTMFYIEFTAKEFLKQYPSVDAKQLWTSKQADELYDFISKMHHSEIEKLASWMGMETVLQLIAKYNHVVTAGQEYNPSFWELTQRKEWKVALEQCEKNAIVKAYVQSSMNEYLNFAKTSRKNAHAKVADKRLHKWHQDKFDDFYGNGDILKSRYFNYKSKHLL